MPWIACDRIQSPRSHTLDPVKKMVALDSMLVFAAWGWGKGDGDKSAAQCCDPRIRAIARQL
jgi:hypothetical protein